MKKNLRILLFILINFPITGFAQQPGPLYNRSDSLNNKTDTSWGRINVIRVYDENPKLTFKSYFILFSRSLVQEFTRPFHMTALDWERFGKFTALFVGVSYTDKPLQKFALRLTGHNPGLRNVSRFVTKFGADYEKLTLGTIAAYGLFFKDQKIITTTLLATQAYYTSDALERVIKLLSGRTRPSYYSANEEAEPKFLGPFSNRKARDGKRQYSFPSGHSTVAFAAATVFATEYKNKIYVPIIAYSVATLVGISRITENVHWATDVFAGAAIGYLQGKSVVNNYHRYGKFNLQKKNTVSFNIQHFNNQFVPGIVYKFK